MRTLHLLLRSFGAGRAVSVHPRLCAHVLPAMSGRRVVSVRTCQRELEQHASRRDGGGVATAPNKHYARGRRDGRARADCEHGHQPAETDGRVRFPDQGRSGGHGSAAPKREGVQSDAVGGAILAWGRAIQ